MNIKVDFDNIVVKEDKNDFNVKVLMLKGEKGDKGDGEQNVIDKIQVNGSDLPVINKTVNVPVPIVDSSISSSSTNPVQNKVIYNALSDKANTSELDNYYEISEIDALISEKPYIFDNVSAMKSYDLQEGAYVITKGYHSANDGGYGEYEILNESLTPDEGLIISLTNGLYAKLIIKNKTITTKQLGFGNNANTNGTLFESFINSGANKLIIDNEYTINGTNIEPLNDITLIGGTLHLTNTLIKANQYNIKVEDLNLDSGRLIDISNGYTEKLGKIEIISCYIQNTAEVIYGNSGSTINSSNYGIEKIIINKCKFNNTSLIPFVIYDMPCDLIIENSNVTNMKQRIVALAPTNENPYVSDILSKIFITVKNNSCINTETYEDDVYQYLAFIFVKGYYAYVSNNYVEGLSLNAQYPTINNNVPVGCHAMYLLCNYVKFNNNIFKNNYNFAYQETTDVIIETCDIFPDVKGNIGEKTITNNTFILEENWLTSKCTELNKNISDLKAPVLWNLLESGENININNNIIDIYFCRFSSRDNHFEYNIVNINDNIFSIKYLFNIDNVLLSITSHDNYKSEYNIRNNSFNIKNCIKTLTLLQGSNTTGTIKASIIGNNFNIENGLTIPRFIYACRGDFDLRDNDIYIKKLINTSNNSYFGLINCLENTYFNGNVNIYAKKIGGSYFKAYLPIEGHLKISGNLDVSKIHYSNWCYFIIPNTGNNYKDLNYIINIKNISTGVEKTCKFSLTFVNNVPYLTYGKSDGTTITKAVSELTAVELYNGTEDTLFSIGSTTISSVNYFIIYLKSSFFAATNDDDLIDLEITTY